MGEPAALVGAAQELEGGGGGEGHLLSEQGLGVEPDFFLDGLHGTAGGDDAKAGGLVAGEGEIAVAHGLVEGGGHLLHAIRLALRRGAAAHAGWPGGIEIEQEGEIRADFADGEFVDESTEVKSSRRATPW